MHGPKGGDKKRRCMGERHILASLCTDFTGEPGKTIGRPFWGVSMKSPQIRKNYMSGTSRIVLGLTMAAALVGAPAWAQDAADEETEEGAIIVTGYRASLENATAEKRNSQQIVESVSAEDIGKLPDASIAESIARLPGLTSQRLNGRANVISIRGLGPDLSTTLLNGREQTSTGDSRAVEFDQYPSEVVNQVVVYKSPTASLIGQGLAGTVDIRTIRPLDAGKQILAFGARGVYADLGKLNAGSSDTGYRVNGTYVDQFADDTLGVALAASYVDESYQTQEFNAWGYADIDPNTFVIGGNRSFVQSTKLKRLGLTGTLQWQPQPELTFTVDGFYSDFEDNQIRRGIELPLGFALNGDDPGTPVNERLNPPPGYDGVTIDPNSLVVRDGIVVGGRFDNVEGVIRNDPSERNAKLYSFGFNTKWDGEDGWHAEFDFGYSRTDRNELIFESYSGTGFNAGVGARDSIEFVSGTKGTRYSPGLDYSDASQIVLTDPLGWGGGVVPQAGYYNNRIVDDELKQYKIAVEKEFADSSFISSVRFGLAYTDRSKSLTPDEFFIRLAGGATEIAIPEEFLLRPTNLGYLGLGPIVSYDPRALLDAGILTLERNGAEAVQQKAYSVSEDLLHAYLQANIDHDIGAARLVGNFGVQVISTDQSSSGVFFDPVSNAAQPLKLGADYTDVLPSINLSFELPNDWVIRFAAAREIQRPRVDDTRVALSYGVNQGAPGGPRIEGGGGNPFLEPYRATAVDLNIEKYFGPGGYISFQGFYKDLTSFIFNGQQPFDFGDLPPPTNPPAGLPDEGILNVPVNTKGGYIYGGEVSSNIPFDAFTSALDGFGFTGGFGYTKTRVTNDFGEKQRIQGFSTWTANGTLYFEKAGFSLRGSARYRSSFLAELSTFGGSRGTRDAVDELIFDAQAGYDFGQIGPFAGLSVFFQAQNLTDERFSTVQNGDPLQVIDYQEYGRRFYLGASFKF